MMKKNGFTLVELVLAMFIVAAIMAASYTAFITLSKGFKAEAKKSEAVVENILGLDLLRYDIEMAGFGLPSGTSSPNINITYNEAHPASAYAGTTDYMPEQYTPDPTCFNDSITPTCECASTVLSCVSSTNEPRAIILADDENPGDDTADSNDDSDVLSIKSLTASLNDAGGKWALRFDDGIAGAPYNQKFNSTEHDIDDNYLVIVEGDGIIKCTGGGSNSTACTAGNDTWAFTISNWSATTPPDSANASALPDPSAAANELFFVYGVEKTTASKPLTLRMPFNRVDYYLQRNKNNFPNRCHPKSYNLVRAAINHNYQNSPESDYNGMRNEMPIMDCVIDFQIAFGIDSDNDGTLDLWVQDNSSATYFGNANSIAQYVRAVKVFILMHEGTYDADYTYEITGNNMDIGVDGNDDGDLSDAGDLLLKSYDFTKLSNWTNYRWKIITITINTANLG